MKNFTGILSFILCTFAFVGFNYNNLTSVSEITNPNIIEVAAGQDAIDAELASLVDAESIINAEKLNYTEFTANHSTLASTVNVSGTIEDGVFDGSDEVPLGIPGFFWGFCFGILGLVVVYVAMEDGEERQEQAKNALWGCVASTVLSGVIYAILLGTAASASTIN